jgi:hypothetical protein
MPRDTAAERAIVAIETHQTEKAIVYRVVVASAEPGSPKISKTFRTRAAAESWERELL